MPEFDNPDYPFLTWKHEESEMLIHFVQEYQKQEKGSTTQKSGKATQKVIHKHLTDKGIKLPQNPEVKIREVKTRMNLLYLLKEPVSRDRLEYSVHDLDAVLKISNTAVGSSKDNTPSEPVRKTFERFKQLNGKLRFYVVVLIENPKYKNRFKDALVLVFRDPKIPKVLYDDVSLIEDLVKHNKLKKSKDWENLVNCLTNK